MAKETGKIKDSIKDIKSVERYVDFSIRGNSNQIPESDPDLHQMINDYSVYLSDKEFLEKWYDKKKFTGMRSDEEFEENGNMEEFGVNEEYYITFKDGSEITVVFKLPDGDFMFADSREAEKGTMAEKYIREYEMDAWDIDIDSLTKEVSGGKKMGKGGEASLKVENEKDLQEVAKYMVKAVKKRWDLKDLIHYFEQDNNFDYKVRDKVASREEIYEMPKNYESILKLLKGIVEANGKKLSPTSSMSKGGKISSKDAGNWVDGSRGIYQGEMIIEIAEKYGFQVEDEDVANKKADGEHYYDLIEEAIQYLNDQAPEGYYFGMTEGNNDFGLWEVEEKGKGGEVYGDALMTFTKSAEIEVIEGEKDDVLDSVNEIFKKGEEVSVYVLEEREQDYHVQFGDGSVAFIPKSVVKVKMGKGGLTPAKARIMLHEGMAHGKPITEQQRKYFGAVATGYAKKEKGGKAGKKGSSFLNDEGAMLDFWEMSREEFLKSNKYYGASDYDATLDEYLSGVVVFDNSKEPEGRYTILNKETGDVFSVAEYPKQDAVAGQYSHNVTDRQNITFGYGWKKGHTEKSLRNILAYEEENWINEMTDSKDIGEKVKDLNSLPEGVKEYIKKIQREGKMAKGGKAGKKSSVDDIFWLITG